MHGNIKLVISYDGTNLYGFQEAEAGPTVEMHLGTALEKIFQTPVKFNACSRTDRGVHAHGQVINFFLPRPFPIDPLMKAINSHLPKEIRIRNIEPVEEAFHATLSAKSKTYRYTIDNGIFPSPFNRKTAWHLHLPLDLSKMEEAIPYLIGHQDYAAFAADGHHEETLRNVHSITLEKKDHLVIVTIKGESFLYRMARALVGTLVYVGLGKFTPEDCKRIVGSRDRTQGGPSAPAHGLTLYHIDY